MYETDDLLFEIQISPTVSHPGLGPLPLGNVAHPTLVEFEVSGMLERYHSDAMTWYHSDLYGGPSPADWATTVRTGVPELIIDKTNIYRADPLTSADFDLVGDRCLPKTDVWKQNLTRAKRKEGSCTRI